MAPLCAVDPLATPPHHCFRILQLVATAAPSGICLAGEACRVQDRGVGGRAPSSLA